MDFYKNKQRKVDKLSRKNRVRGKRGKAYGDQFESLIEVSCKRYKQQGIAYISKTYPPFTTLRRQKGQIVGFYGKTGQPDFAGTLKNGRSIVFEAKHTNTTNIPFERIADHQKQALKKHSELGAEVFILVAFKLDDIYKIPIKDWLGLEKTIGKKSLNEKDLTEYKIGKDRGLIDFINDEENDK